MVRYKSPEEELDPDMSRDRKKEGENRILSMNVFK